MNPVSKPLTGSRVFLDACSGLPTPYRPVWYMRQAGRYQPEYRKIREKYSLLQICRLPEVCAEVTLLPIQQLGVDAAILFSDITLPFEGMNIPFEIVEGRGPVMASPYRDSKSIASITNLIAEESLVEVKQTIEILRDRLSVPLIGFIGAPFTLASYLIEGGPSKNYYYTKQMMYNEPELWHSLMHKLATNMGTYLRFQVESGAQALQIFDSWVGCLSEQDYIHFVLPHMQTLFGIIADLEDIPVIPFGVGNKHLLGYMAHAGGTVLGIDWRTSFAYAKEISVGSRIKAFQGNLDPALILAEPTYLKGQVHKVLEQMQGNGYIFNLGHGIMPQASIEVLKQITDWVHEAGV